MDEEDEQSISGAIVAAITFALGGSKIKGRFEALEARLAQLEQRPVVHDRGVWCDGETYLEGAVVSHGGSAWLCRQTHYATGAEPDHEAFRLFVKRGKDLR